MSNTRVILIFCLVDGSTIEKQEIIPTASLEGEEFTKLLQIYSNFSNANHYELSNGFSVTEAPTGRGAGRSFTYVNSRTFINPAKVMHIRVTTLELKE
jgi:hypothetical protein